MNQNLSRSNPLLWGGKSAFTHTLIVGPTRCGKTASLLKPMLYQILLKKRMGIPVGLSVIEPKGDMALMVAEMCDAMEIPCNHLDPVRSTKDKWNVMDGEVDDVAETTVAVLKSLFGKQESFFAIVQELSSRSICKLLKTIYENNMDITDVLKNLRDRDLLQRNVDLLKSTGKAPDLVNFFEHELLGSGDLAKKYQQFVIGLRAQLENLISNAKLQKITTGKSTFNIDTHFENGGVLAVNTALGELKAAGDAFGQFSMMHLQLATLRRKGTEETRIPHYLFGDEYSRYINPGVEMFLSIAAEYKVAGIFALQSLNQLEIESGKLSARAMKQAIMASTRNKIAFGGLEYPDAEEFSKIFGKKERIIRQKTYEGGLVPQLFPKAYRDIEEEIPRYAPSLLMDGLPDFHFVAKLLSGITPQKPVIAKGSFVPRDWKELLIDKQAVMMDNRTILQEVWDRIMLPFHMTKQKKKEKYFSELLSENPFENKSTLTVEEENKRVFEEWLSNNASLTRAIQDSSSTLKGGDVSKDSNHQESPGTDVTSIELQKGETIINDEVTTQLNQVPNLRGDNVMKDSVQFDTPITRKVPEQTIKIKNHQIAENKKNTNDDYQSKSPVTNGWWEDDED
ncbi:type IV secretory system conjugative DNA transfer family protein (plasmid) [Brevibacillus laterosporus]|uniref:Type IV secretory system conjugative DNA transfer family protein n=1 Tax=Brevibacillus laterosporus TaxID=1465 RepID=A0A518V1N5_BRELA|nr:type IV secretory system conjugative DNA transfer family protein [Brevibacillus laterosporus]